MTLILPKSKIPLFLPSAGFVAQLNRASDYGSEGYRFESYRGHNKPTLNRWVFFVQTLREFIANLNCLLKIDEERPEYLLNYITKWLLTKNQKGIVWRD